MNGAGQKVGETGRIDFLHFYTLPLRQQDGLSLQDGSAGAVEKYLYFPRHKRLSSFIHNILQVLLYSFIVYIFICIEML